MDFVVAGFGLGAVLMLVGFAVRDLGPLWNRSQRDDAAARSWSDLCRSVGAMIVSGGFAICVVTLLLLVAGVGDDTGALLVAAVSAVAVIGSGVGSMLTIRRFTEARAALRPTFGPDRGLERYEPATRSFRPAARAVRRTPEVETEDEVEVREPQGESEAGPEVVREDAAVVAAKPVLEEAPSPSPGRIFASPLLADVANGAATVNGSGFRSSVLADLSGSGGEGSVRGYSSSVLADLAGEGGDRTAEESVIGPPVPEGLGSDSGDADAESGEKMDEKLGVHAEGEKQPAADDGPNESDDESVKDDEVGAVATRRQRLRFAPGDSSTSSE